MATGKQGVQRFLTNKALFYRMGIDRSMLDRENGATLDRIFAVEYLLGITRA
jgi:hypothetical protein